MVKTDLPTIMFKQLQDYSIVDLFYLQFPAANQISRPPASECMLYFCIQKYSAAVKSGTLQEQLISTFPNMTTPADIARSALQIPVYQDNCTAVNTTGQCQKNPAVTNLHPEGAVYGPYSTAESFAVGNVSISPPGDTHNYRVGVPTLILAREWMQPKFSANFSWSTDTKSLSDVAQLFVYTDYNPSPIMQRIA